jgi:hypothetical protein
MVTGRSECINLCQPVLKDDRWDGSRITAIALKKEISRNEPRGEFRLFGSRSMGDSREYLFRQMLDCARPPGWIVEDAISMHS